METIKYLISKSNLSREKIAIKSDVALSRIEYVMSGKGDLKTSDKNKIYQFFRIIPEPQEYDDSKPNIKSQKHLDQVIKKALINLLEEQKPDFICNLFTCIVLSKKELTKSILELLGNS